MNIVFCEHYNSFGWFVFLLDVDTVPVEELSLFELAKKDEADVDITSAGGLIQFTRSILPKLLGTWVEFNPTEDKDKDNVIAMVKTKVN